MIEFGHPSLKNTVESMHYDEVNVSNTCLTLFTYKQTNTKNTILYSKGYSKRDRQAFCVWDTGASIIAPCATQKQLHSGRARVGAGQLGITH